MKEIKEPKDETNFNNNKYQDNQVSTRHTI